MKPQAFCRLARRLLRHPTAPYFEHAVRTEAEAICAEHDLEFQRDPFGNVLARVKTAPRSRPLILAAHLDHPGFEVVQFGFQTAAVCVALGNYHNCGQASRIKAEYISVADACGMVELLVATARQMPQYTRFVSKLPKRLHRLLRQARPKLRRTAVGCEE
jgi:putative aminopeptidase FrvX